MPKRKQKRFSPFSRVFPWPKHMVIATQRTKGGSSSHPLVLEMELPTTGTGTTNTTTTRQSACPCCDAWSDRRRPEKIVLVEGQASDSTVPSNHQTLPPTGTETTWGTCYVLRNAKVITLHNTTETTKDDEWGQHLDVWVAGGKIWALTPSIPDQTYLCCPTLTNPIQEIDVSGCIICPGLVDMHLHCVGGGGEAGFGSRTPAATTTDLIEAGVTTFVATLGTDSVTRGMENLVAQTRALTSVRDLPDPATAAGPTTSSSSSSSITPRLTGRAWLGGYSFPIENTITGSVRRDVTLIPEIIGVGELAISDHRGSYPSTLELLRLVSEVRVAGMLSSKAGVTYFHVGEDASGLQPLRDVVHRNPVLQTFMIPTHMERSSQLVQEGLEWIQAGGRIDFSGWPDRQRRALQEYQRDEEIFSLVKERLSISSDSYGSINVFDEEGNLIRYSYGLPSTLLRTLVALVYEDGLSLPTVLGFLCRNPARTTGMDQGPDFKGSIRVGGDAGLLVLKMPSYPLDASWPCDVQYGLKWPSSLGILRHVIAKGTRIK